MTTRTTSTRLRGLIGAGLGVVLAGAALVPLQTPAQALVTPVTVSNGASTNVTTDDDHYHPGDTIQITGSGFAVDPSTASNPGYGVLAVKVNGDDYAGDGFPWTAGGPSYVDPDSLPTAGGSGGYAAFRIEGGAFSGHITIPANWDTTDPVVLNFLGGSLSTEVPGKVLSPIGVEVPVNLLDEDEAYAEITTNAHTPGSNNNKVVGVKLRNYQRAGGLGGQKVAFKFDGAGDTVHCAVTDSDGDADTTVPLPNALDSLTAGTHQLTVLAGSACGEGTELPARSTSLPFKVTTAAVTSTAHFVGGTLTLQLNGFQANSSQGQKVAVQIGENGPGATNYAGVTPGTSTAICIQADTSGNGTATVGIPNVEFPEGDLFVILLAGTACGAGVPGSNGPVRSIPLPITISDAPQLAATGAVTVTGAAKVGYTRTATAPTYNQQGVVPTYQWLRSGAVIVGATARTYTVRPADAGKGLSVRVTGTLGGVTVTTTSTAPVVKKGTIALKKKPVTSGTFKVGKTVKTTAGAWSVAGVTVRYQWLRNGKAIAKATKKNYKLVKADKKKRITVRVTVLKAGYANASSTAAAKLAK